MDAGSLLQLFALIAVALGLFRFVANALERAETGLASLFIPPDWTPTWPRGVQESDEPWGWHPPVDPVEVIDRDASSEDPGPRVVLPISGASRYTLRPRRVAPIRFRALPPTVRGG